jgi:O-antigen/teichoic acid export membrane protein
MPSLIENSRKSSIYVAAAQVINRVLGMIVTVILARNLTVSEYGIYNLFLGSILIFSFFTNFGIAGSLQRFLAEYASRKKFGLFFRTLFFSLKFRFVSGILFFLEQFFCLTVLPGILTYWRIGMNLSFFPLVHLPFFRLIFCRLP